MEKQKYTVRANRERARIWIEGGRLTRAGFIHGARFDVNQKGRKLVLSLAGDDGARKVSGTGDRPIIDLVGKSCEPFATGDSVAITYREGSIVITQEGGA